MIRRSTSGFTFIMVIVALAVSIGVLITTVFSYQQHKESSKAIHAIQQKVDKMLTIDSVLSVYEIKHRARLDSIEAQYATKIDSLSILIFQLKDRADVIQAGLVATDSVLPHH